MNSWLLLPVKPFSLGKSRLSTSLSDQERFALNRAFMRHVLETALASQLFANIVVVSRDTNALEIARAQKVHTIAEYGYGLNNALAQGRSFALAKHASALLVLPADLPLLTINDLQLIFHKGQLVGSVVIAPSRDGGTNALFLRPPAILPFQFGRNSFDAHFQFARKQRLAINTVTSPGLQTDIDSPDDLKALPANFLSSFA